MAEHTKGPWKAFKRKEPVGFAEWEIHWSDEGECVAEVVHEEANAHLIAAAPELLAALEMVYAGVGSLSSDGERVSMNVSYEVFEAMRLAIDKAKAEGRL